MYSLIRERDNKGDYGPASMVVNEFGDVDYDARPEVGKQITVGSLQHWWSTTTVIEILEDTPKIVKFRTLNSIYTWEKI